MANYLIDWFISWLIELSVDWLNNQLIDWLISCWTWRWRHCICWHKWTSSSNKLSSNLQIMKLLAWKPSFAWKLNFSYKNTTKNIPVVPPSFPIKMLCNLVKGFIFYDLPYKQTNRDFYFIYNTSLKTQRCPGYLRQLPALKRFYHKSQFRI